MWLDERIFEPGALEEFCVGASSGKVEWEETGIRSYVKEEVRANRAYLQAGAELAEAKQALEVSLFVLYSFCARTLTLRYKKDFKETNDSSEEAQGPAPLVIKVGASNIHSSNVPPVHYF